MLERRQFLHLASAALSGSLFSSFKVHTAEFEFDEIIGKKTPDLYGEVKKLRKEPFEALRDMKSDAAKEKIDILLVSAYRSFLDQQNIWDRKYDDYVNNLSHTPLQAIARIIEYSTIPGTSRHHWGTDIDIVDTKPNISGDRLLPQYFEEDGPYGKLKDWLNRNAAHYGFHEVYTDAPSRRGFKYEPWHFSYAVLSKPMLKAYMDIDFIKLLQSLAIKGSDQFTKDFIDSYWKENMLDINPFLIPR